MDCSLPGFSVHGILQARILEWVAVPFSSGSSQPRGWTQVSRIAGGFFADWASRKPKNTAVGSCSLLQGIFPTQGSNPGLLHCRRILYCLSQQGWFKFITFIVHFISIVITSAPPRASGIRSWRLGTPSLDHLHSVWRLLWIFCR